MVKYKLIKKYPGSPEIGDKEIFNFNYLSPDGRWSFNGNKGPLLKIPQEHVENNPEFWEKVEEKTYEVITLVNEPNKIFASYNKHSKALYQSREEWLKYFLDSGLWKIHSVKRLSDGEIFTIGDTVHENITEHKDRWTIKEFSLKDTRCFTCGVNIENISKTEELLCVPIGTYFRHTADGSIDQIIAITRDTAKLKNLKFDYKIKHCNANFKDKLWIPIDLEKEPLFTAKEVESMYYEVVFSRVTNLTEQLKKQIKVKIEEKLRNG